MTIEEIKKEAPNAYTFYMLLLEQYEFQEHPWRKPSDAALKIYWELVPSQEQYYYDLLIKKHRNHAFDSLCEEILIKSGEQFDAWGSYQNQVYKDYVGSLEEQESVVFYKYLETRKFSTIDIETAGKYWRHRMSFALLSEILSSARDERQRFRFLASIVEFLSDYEGCFTEDEKSEMKMTYQELKKQTQAPFTHLILSNKPALIKDMTNEETAVTTIDWLKSKGTFAAIMGFLQKEGYIKATNNELMRHFSFLQEKMLPTRYRQIKADLSRSRHSPNHGDLQAIISELELLLQELRKYLPS